MVIKWLLSLITAMTFAACASSDLSRNTVSGKVITHGTALPRGSRVDLCRLKLTSCDGMGDYLVEASATCDSQGRFVFNNVRRGALGLLLMTGEYHWGEGSFYFGYTGGPKQITLDYFKPSFTDADIR